MARVTRVLVANRGEIAVRVIRACREAGISPVAVYSEADADAPFVALADAALCIGPGPARESYLRGDAVIAAAQRLGADALHPGYGFLSENADFADACAAAGIAFLGPPGETIRRLGDKIGAKQRMIAAGVPVVPGYSGDDQSDTVLRAEAERVGFPLLIKASAGGGGRGMRRVEGIAGFEAALTEARQEARAAFGDDRVLIERLIERPRHVEVQLFGDTHGNVVHLAERECSLQRRHQKIIEESPAPGLSEALRGRVTAAAVAAGHAVGYVGAGTVEFLVSGEECFFLEVNTRLQVEHTVTEGVTGLDLVRWQFLVARGEPLPLTQEQLCPRGHTIEARVYAEDPATGFLPSLGVLRRWRPPSGPGIRVDAGYEEGMTVPPFYDPMLAKVIASGADRTEALARLDRALAEFAILGVTTNIEYLRALLADPEFVAGRTHTGFLGERLPHWRPPSALSTEALLALAALEALPLGEAATASPLTPSAGPWIATDGWRNAR